MVSERLNYERDTRHGDPDRVRTATCHVVHPSLSHSPRDPGISSRCTPPLAFLIPKRVWFRKTNLAHYAPHAVERDWSSDLEATKRPERLTLLGDLDVWQVTVTFETWRQSILPRTITTACHTDDTDTTASKIISSLARRTSPTFPSPPSHLSTISCYSCGLVCLVPVGVPHSSTRLIFAASILILLR